MLLSVVWLISGSHGIPGSVRDTTICGSTSRPSGGSVAETCRSWQAAHLSFVPCSWLCQTLADMNPQTARSTIKHRVRERIIF